PANAKWMLLYLAALIGLVANPIVGPFWIDRLTPATHWRLAYLFPIGLGAGLLAPCIVRAFGKHRFAMIAALVALAFVGASYEKDAFFEGKSPLAPRIDDDAVAFGRDVREPLRGRSVLTDRHLSRVIGLIEPSVRLEVTRSEETLHLFRAVGREDEALRRIKAQALLNEGVRTPERDAAL